MFKIHTLLSEYQAYTRSHKNGDCRVGGQFSEFVRSLEVRYYQYFFKVFFALRLNRSKNTFKIYCYQHSKRTVQTRNKNPLMIANIFVPEQWGIIQSRPYSGSGDSCDEEQDLKFFCNQNYAFKTNGFGISYWSMQRRDTVYRRT